MDFDWINLLQVLAGVLFGGGVGLFSAKAAVRKSNAEADMAENDADRAEVERLISELDHQQKTIENLLTLNTNLAERLSKLNATVDKHIDRNRELSDRLYKSETEINRVNERIIELIEERDTERGLKEHFKLWHCRREGCGERLPPNEKLKGLKYEPPKKNKRRISAEPEAET